MHNCVFVCLFHYWTIDILFAQPGILEAKQPRTKFACMAPPCRHFIGNKVNDCIENPIDVGLYRISEALLPFMRTTGHTPNLVTTYSVVCKAAAVGSVWVGDWRTFTVTAVLAYFFDCMVRGLFAYGRKHTPRRMASMHVDIE